MVKLFVNRPEMRTILALKGEMSFTELQDMVKGSNETLTRILPILQRKGLIIYDRSKCGFKGASKISLTFKGLEISEILRELERKLKKSGG